MVIKMFRKKPVVIEAVQWTGENVKEVEDFTSSTKVGYAEEYDTLTIPTLEGDHTANKGDWIIKGVKGEFYPCKPDIFEQTYDEVPGQASPKEE